MDPKLKKLNDISRCPFVIPAVMVPVEDAMDYARDILAGVDNLFIELGNQLIDELPHGLSGSHRRILEDTIHTRIQAARSAISEHDAAKR